MDALHVFKAADEDEHLVYVEVYVPYRPDSDGEYMTAEDVRQTAYNFMRTRPMQSVDSYHNNILVEGGCIVESFIAREGDDVFIPGAWVVGIHIDNEEMWKKILDGEINGVSLEAEVHKEPHEVTIEIPPVVSGQTSEELPKATGGAESHTHTFYVSYSPEGELMGGLTSVTNGHSHRILKGSRTEPGGDGHIHRFSHIEQLHITEGDVITENGDEDGKGA